MAKKGERKNAKDATVGTPAATPAAAKPPAPPAATVVPAAESNVVIVKKAEPETVMVTSRQSQIQQRGQGQAPTSNTEEEN